MREIKFRAWDEDIEAFIPLQEWIEELKKTKYRILGNEFVSNFKNLPNLIIALNGPNVKIMRYTGIKDINNIEICKGDIVSFYNDEEYKLKPTNAIVIYEAGAFMLKHKKLGKEYLGEIDIENMCVKVIGNIYENPELLEVEE